MLATKRTQKFEEPAYEGFPKSRDTLFLGLPIIRSITFWGLYWGPPILVSGQVSIPNLLQPYTQQNLNWRSVAKAHGRFVKIMQNHKPLLSALNPDSTREAKKMTMALTSCHKPPHGNFRRDSPKLQCT